MTLMLPVEESTLASEFENDETAFADLLDEIHMQFTQVKRGRRLRDWAADVSEKLTDSGKLVLAALHEAAQDS